MLALDKLDNLSLDVRARRKAFIDKLSDVLCISDKMQGVAYTKLQFLAEQTSAMYNIYAMQCELNTMQCA